MPTNLHIDDRLLAEAQKLGGRDTKRDTVEQALREYVARRKRLKALQAFGTIEFYSSWDYKTDRRAADRRVDFVREHASPWPAHSGHPRAVKRRQREK